MSLFKPVTLKVHSAVETAFGTAEASFTGLDVQCTARPDWKPAQDVLPDTSITTALTDSRPAFLGLKNKSKLTFPTYLRGTGTAGTGLVSVASLPECLMLNSVWGGQSLGTGTTVTGATSSTTVIAVTSAAGLSEHQAVMINGEANVIASIDTGATPDTISLIRALSAAPTAGTVVYASATYYPAESLTGSLQFQYRESVDEWFRILGCNGTCNFADLNPGQVPKLTWDWSVANWEVATSAAIAAPTYSLTNFSPIPGNSSLCYSGTYGVTTRTVINPSAISINPGLGIEALPSVSGKQGVQSYVRSAIAPTVEFTVPFDNDYLTAFSAGSVHFLHYQIGGVAGNTILIEVCRFQIQNVQDNVAVGQQMGSKVTGKGLLNSESYTGVAKAAIRLHLL